MLIASMLLCLASVQSMLEFLRGICSDVKVVQGDFDDFESPEQLVSSSSSRHCGAASMKCSQTNVQQL
jgi:hypothetical protein